jgi:hypothetical protein
MALAYDAVRVTRDVDSLFAGEDATSTALKPATTSEDTRLVLVDGEVAVDVAELDYPFCVTMEGVDHAVGRGGCRLDSRL